MLRKTLAKFCPPAPKRNRGGVTSPKPTNIAAAASSAVPKGEDVQVHHETSADLLRNMTPDQIDKLERQIVDASQREEKLLNEDNLFQMDISTRDTTKPIAARVFWKNVTVAPWEGGSTFYNVLLDGKKVRAFEANGQPLLCPTLDYAHAAAREWASQEGVVNKSLMPLTDIASASSFHVGPSGVGPRIDYVSSFLKNDNTFFRVEQIEKEQDKVLEPIHEWFIKTFEIPHQLPRVEKLKYPNVPDSTIQLIRDVLNELQLNTYQAVALCILCQYTASLILPLALLMTHGHIVDTREVLRISRMEEQHNVQLHGQVPGYHDIREADVRLKVAAAVAAWRLTDGLSLDRCVPPVSKKEESKK